MFDILSAAKPFGKKTHLMYKGNLSYQQLELYLGFILMNGLLEARNVEGSKQYVVTGKGGEFIKLYQELHHLMSKEKIDAQSIADRKQLALGKGVDNGAHKFEPAPQIGDFSPSGEKEV